MVRHHRLIVLQKRGRFYLARSVGVEPTALQVITLDALASELQPHGGAPPLVSITSSNAR